MPYKSFTTQRQWHNTLLITWLAPFLVLSGVLVLAWYSSFVGLYAAAGIIVLGGMVALLRDLGDRCYYSFRNNMIVLETRNHRKEIPIAQITDASLIDRMAARHYIQGRMQAMGINDRKERRRIVKEFVRFCTVDIGFTSLTMGLGRSIIDRLPIARKDLVLLRLKGGADHLLSPRYDQGLVDLVNRLISART